MTQIDFLFYILGISNQALDTASQFNELLLLNPVIRLKLKKEGVLHLVVNHLAVIEKGHIGNAVIGRIAIDTTTITTVANQIHIVVEDRGHQKDRGQGHQKDQGHQKENVNLKGFNCNSVIHCIIFLVSL